MLIQPVCLYHEWASFNVKSLVCKAAGPTELKVTTSFRVHFTQRLLMLASKRNGEERNRPLEPVKQVEAANKGPN
ncbi:unnamed protein product [Protopolystoma xenopodis]|uniref:Uncharacterized protein n=1 Tax=Protopolystoma xenopodis TaxID=117903 RepID=A0A3S5AYC5_9PLAT|nr:unnamed protein product [Protopolystoma xenopodis]